MPDYSDKLNIVICNDREPDRLLLRERLLELFEEDERMLPVIATFSSAASMLSRMKMRTKPYDLIFLNSKLSKENGYVCAEQIRKIYYDPKIVFLGSSKEEAFETMRNRGIYLLTPPFDREEVRTALRIFDENLDKKRLNFHMDGENYSILQERICYITGARNDVTLWVGGERKLNFTFQKSMTQLMKELAPTFQRIRRNAILNYTHVDQLSVRDRCFIMDDGTRFEIPQANFTEQLMRFRTYEANVDPLQIRKL